MGGKERWRRAGRVRREAEVKGRYASREEGGRERGEVREESNHRQKWIREGMNKKSKKGEAGLGEWVSGVKKQIFTSTG